MSSNTRTHLGLADTGRLLLVTLFATLVVFFSPATPTEAACADPPTGLVAWWTGDGDAGDVFGTWGGTLVNDTTYADGMVGQAFSFDGSGDGVLMPDGVGDFGAAPFAVEFWLYPTVLAANTFLLGENSPIGSVPHGWDIRLSDEVIQVYGVDLWRLNITSDVEVTAGAWHHVALSSTASTVNLYVDGIPAGSCPRSTIDNASDSFRLGYTPNYGGAALNGLLDEVKIYNRNLGATEIQAIYTAGADGSCRPCAHLPADALAWWRAEDDATDEIGSADGTLIGDAGFADGKVGRSFSFDGSGDAVAAPDSTIWDFGTGSFSLAAWFKAGTVGYYSQIMTYNNGYTTKGSWYIRLSDAGKPMIGLCSESGSGSCLNISGADRVDDDDWHLIVGVRDAASSKLSLYIDGSLVAGPNDIGSPSVVGDTDNRMTIGAGGWGGGGLFEDFAGLIDEPMIFTRALTESEIRALANAGSSGVCTECTNPPRDFVSWWEAEDDPNDTAGANHGIEVNGATYAEGLVGQAFSLDGIGDYVDVPDDPSLDFDPNQPMTVDFWAYRTGSATEQYIIGKRADGCASEDFNYQVVLDPNGLCFGGKTIPACSTGGSDDLPVDAWTHVAGVFDGSNVVLYLNGSEAARVAGTLGAPNSESLRFGTSGTCADFDGLVDEVEIHSRALSPGDIYAVYSAGAHGKCELDAIPDAFTFTDQTGVPLDSVQTSNQINVSDINATTTIDITTCTSTSCEYQLNDGAWTAAAGTAVEGDAVRVRQTSSASMGTITLLTLDIGGVTDTFSVTTVEPRTLTVTLVGDGTGSVTSSPAGIDCPTTDCSAIFGDLETVTLTATPDEGSVFSGWAGDADCSDGEVEMLTNVDCTAVFDDPLFADGFESGNTSAW